MAQSLHCGVKHFAEGITVIKQTGRYAFLLLATACLPAQAATLSFYTDLAAWEAAVNSSSLNLGISHFETNAANVAHANGGTTVAPTDENVVLGPAASFAAAQTGLPWSFTISSYNADLVIQPDIIYNDVPPKTPAEPWKSLFTDVLSIGKFNSDGMDNDNFLIEITGGPALYAFGLDLVNNVAEGNEWLEVFATRADTGVAPIDNTGDNPLGIVEGWPGVADPANPFTDIPFIGLVSDTPFAWMEFNENNSSNDIGIANLRFAGVIPAPLPASFWLMLVPLAVMGIDRRARTPKAESTV
jgi:hypothetical protein